MTVYKVIFSYAGPKNIGRTSFMYQEAVNDVAAQDAAQAALEKDYKYVTITAVKACVDLKTTKGK